MESRSERCRPRVRALAYPAAAVLAALAIGPAAHARSVKAKDITCEEFLALGTDVQPQVVYWIEGVSRSGTPETAELDLDAVERPVAVVVTACRKAPEATLWEKVEKLFRS